MALETHLLGFSAVAIGFIAFAYAWSKYVEKNEQADKQTEETMSVTETDESRGES